MLIERRNATLLATAALAALIVGRVRRAPAAIVVPAASGAGPHVQHTEAEWRRLLTPAQFDVLREQGTEAPWSSPLDYEHRSGTYACAGCRRPLYSSDTKFESGTGWPSFWKPLDGATASRTDTSFGMDRDEIHCADCGGHLGHVFSDGPRPTGLRYCMNGVAMTFVAD